MRSKAFRSTNQKYPDLDIGAKDIVVLP